mmetsp:Transcript_1456/g.2835  ORF Transcript_1456/g.2835 Transcript_1456/m.2835 type:complete len:108 (+) Transcript_1456:365-688(+)
MDPRQLVLMLIFHLGGNRTSVLLHNLIIETQMSFLSHTQRKMNSIPTPSLKDRGVSNHHHNHHPFQPCPFLPPKTKPSIHHYYEHPKIFPNEPAQKTPESHRQPQFY